MIVKTLGVCGGNPRIDGTRIPVWIIAAMYWEGRDSIPNIAATYDVSVDQIVEAIQYAEKHKEETLHEIQEQREA